MRSTRNRRSRIRTNRKSTRPTLREAISSANSRAKQRTNRRLGRRQGLTSVKAAIASASADELIHLGVSQRIIRWIIAILLIPVCIIATKALFSVGYNDSTFWKELIATKQFFFFSIGFFIMAGWFFTGVFQRMFLYFYVLGHELTHAIFVYICGGKVAGISVSADGGYIMTNKSNILIALSPYFVPFWSVIILTLSSALEIFTEIPYHNEALYFLIGASWTFHLLWTLWMIPRDQPDLKENGVFFSLMVIYLANVIILSVMLCIAPGNLTWDHWAVEVYNSWASLKEYIHDLTLSFR